MSGTAIKKWDGRQWVKQPFEEKKQKSEGSRGGGDEK